MIRGDGRWHQTDKPYVLQFKIGGQIHETLAACAFAHKEKTGVCLCHRLRSAQNNFQALGHSMCANIADDEFAVQCQSIHQGPALRSGPVPSGLNAVRYDTNFIRWRSVADNSVANAVAHCHESRRTSIEETF